MTKQFLVRAISRENVLDPTGGRVAWSNHAVAELVAEGWRRTDVEHGLQESEVIEDYPTVHRPLPDCLVLGWLSTDTPFHAVIAVDEPKRRLLVVTVYRPEEEEWKDDWRTRIR